MEHGLDLPEKDDLRRPLNTIGQVIVAECDIRVSCDDCQHVGRIDLIAFAKKFGVNYPTVYARLAKHLRCSACHGKRMTFEPSRQDGNGWWLG